MKMSRVPFPTGVPFPLPLLPPWLSRHSEHARASPKGTLWPGLDDTAGVRTKPGASPLSPTPASESREPKSSPPPPATRKTQHPDLPPGASQHGHRGAQEGSRATDSRERGGFRESLSPLGAPNAPVCHELCRPSRSTTDRQTTSFSALVRSQPACHPQHQLPPGVTLARSRCPHCMCALGHCLLLPSLSPRGRETTNVPGWVASVVRGLPASRLPPP